MNRATLLFLKFIRFISKPLIVSRAVEILHILSWIWYTGLVYARGYVNDPFLVLTDNVPKWLVSTLFATIALLSAYGLYTNSIGLRKIMLILHSATIVYIVVFFFISGVIPSVTGYLIALVIVTWLVLWRMDITMS